MEKPDQPVRPTRSILPLAQWEMLSAIVLTILFSFLFVQHRPFCMLLTLQTLLGLGAGLGLYNFKPWGWYLSAAQLPCSILGLLIVALFSFSWWYSLLPFYRLLFIPLLSQARGELIVKP